MSVTILMQTTLNYTLQYCQAIVATYRLWLNSLYKSVSGCAETFFS